MRLHRLCLVWVLLNHAIAGSFELAVGALYSHVLSVDMLRFAVTRLETRILPLCGPFIVVSLTIGVCHALLLTETIWELLGRPWVCLSRSRNGVVPIQPVLKPTIQCTALRSWTTKRSQQLNDWWWGWNSEITRVRMLWEIALQTFQAHKISQLVATVWINQAMVVVITHNCWLPLMVQYMMRGRSATTMRLVRMMLDMWLDLWYCIAIPLAIFVPYYRTYRVDLVAFPLLNYYMDSWYTSAISELRQVFVTSWIDFVSKATASVSFLYRLYAVRQTSTKRLESITKTPAKTLSQFSKSVDLILFLWGLVVVALHIHVSVVAHTGRNASDCLLEMRPWGVPHYTCTVLELSCTSLKSSGDQSDLDKALSTINPRFVDVLIISHCPRLHVPKGIKSLPNLMMLKIYNSTIVAWEEDAALREPFHPQLQVVYFVRVNMSEIPMGLLADDTPESLWDIEFCITNLTDLPAKITTAWRRVRYLLMEGNPEITSIPLSVMSLPALDSLYMAMNGIRSLPDELLANQTLFQFSLDGNPLERVPRMLGSRKRLRFVGLCGTNISDIPEWWPGPDTQNDGMVVQTHAFDTPLCARLMTQQTTTAGDVDLFREGSSLEIDCRAPFTSSLYSYPLLEEDMWRRQARK